MNSALRDPGVRAIFAAMGGKGTYRIVADLGFEDIASDATQGGWEITDVLRDHLTRLGVPVLGGLPIGHGLHPTMPLGTQAALDTAAGTLSVEPAVY